MTNIYIKIIRLIQIDENTAWNTLKDKSELQLVD